VTGLDGERLGVWEAAAHPAAPGDPAPGELSLEGRVPVLGCAPGTLALTTVQPAGRKRMPGDAYLRGLRGLRG
jgi:methionyl-tRNA formyltransferase